MAEIGDESSKLNLLLLCFPLQSHVAPMLSLARELLSHDDADREITWMPAFPPIKVSDFPVNFQNGERDGPTIFYAAQRVAQAKKADWLLFNSFDELDRDMVSYFPKGLAIGPLIPTADQAFRKEDKSCIKWLDSKPHSSVIYVSFGSIAVLSMDQLRELAEGLEESGCYFLLVIRQDLAEKTEQFMLDFCSRNRDNGLVISWAPQFEVLNHPSVAGFLTHCGWNSILESLYSGIPMLVWPFIAEQTMNCFFVSEVWKVGFRLIRSIGSKDQDLDLVKKDEVSKLIGKLMKEEKGLQVRKNASRFKIEARKAYSEVGSSRKNLEAFAQDLKKKVL